MVAAWGFRFLALQEVFVMPAHFESGVLVGQSAWHGQGTVIPADDDRRFDLETCLELSGLDWRVDLARCFYLFGDDGEHCDEVPGSFVTVRTLSDGSVEPLGTVGSKYRPLQNREAFEWFQPWLDTKEVAIETAGSLEGGKSVWVMARILREDVEVSSGDRIAKYLMLSSRHDGLGATACGFTPIRIVCSNTMQMAHDSRSSKLLRVRHTAGQHESLSAIRDTIDMIDMEFIATAEQYRRMLSCKLSPSELRRYVRLVNDIGEDIPEKSLSGRMRNRINRVCQLAASGMGQQGDLTAWSAYNGFTQYLTHNAGSDAEKRLRSNMDGAYAKLNQRAFNLAVELSA